MPCTVGVLHEGVAAGVAPKSPHSAVVAAEHGQVVVDVHVFFVLGACGGFADSLQHTPISRILNIRLSTIV